MNNAQALVTITVFKETFNRKLLQEWPCTWRRKPELRKH